MSNVPSPKPHGRHRASPPCDDPSNVEPLEELIPTQQIPVVPQTRRERLDRERAAAAERRQHHKTATLATGSMFALTAGAGVLGLHALSAPARSEIMARSAVAPQQPGRQSEVLADAAPLVFDTAKVATVAAPPPPPPPPPPAPVVIPAAKPAPVAPQPQAAPAPAAAPVAAPAPTDRGSAVRAAIVEAAKAQVGQTQDCVKMVADALATVGIYHYKWPVEYYQIGYAVSAAEAVPGDLIYYVNGMGASVAGMAHIAIYIGNGQAVHGGWNGNQTIIYSVNVGSGPNYIRLNV